MDKKNFTLRLLGSDEDANVAVAAMNASSRAAETLMIIRGVAHMAVYSGLPEDDVAEILLVAASLMRTTEELKATVDDTLDCIMDKSDMALDVAYEAVCSSEEGEDAKASEEDDDGERFAPLVELLLEHDLVNKDQGIHIDINPAEEASMRVVTISPIGPDGEPLKGVNAPSVELFIAINRVLNEVGIMDNPHGFDITVKAA